jgi:protein CrcB
MLTYLWIALGGALGSVGRAWLAIAVARLTGPQFPWGTILVNIAGSFVIGFFGALTGPEGRFSVPGDARAFVMVGICGGFTTFSSFSLQTFDLLRDGRAGQAAGNVLLSVALCLLAVSIGHYAAGALSPARVIDGEARPGPVVLAVLHDPNEALGVLASAERWATLRGGVRVTALAFRLPPGLALLPSEEVMTAEREEELSAGGAERREAVFAAFQSWRQGRATYWLEIEGHPASTIADLGRRAEAIVLGRPENALEREALHAALFAACRPVLLVPNRTEPHAGSTVAIAWRDDPCAEHAVRASLAALRAAGRVVVLRAGEGPGRDGGLPSLLAESGVRPELVRLPAKGKQVAPALLAEARAQRADLLVMGAFAHGFWREALLGGVTRYVLAEADLPVLMSR